VILTQIRAKSHDTVFPDRLIDNIVRSWTFAALEQVLRETSTSSLPFTRFVSSEGTRSSSKILPFGKNAQEQKSILAEQKSMAHPTRSTSLNSGHAGRPQLAIEPPYAQNPPSGQVVFANGQYQERPAPNQDNASLQAKTGQQELAGARAQLLVVQRRILEYVGKSMGWSVGWAAVLSILNPKEELHEVDLNDDDESESEEEEEDEEEDDEPETEKKLASTTPTVGLSAAAIVNAALSIDQFRQFWETLSDLVVKHYMAAGQTKSGESVLGDLAALRFELGDFGAAAMYFASMADLFKKTRWNTVETTMLKMYAQCLRKLNRKDEYLRTLLDLLAKSAASKRSIRTAPKQVKPEDTPDSLPKDWLDDDKVDTTGALEDLVDYSQQLTYDMNVPMANYFNDIVVEPYVRHFDDKDGFQLRLQFRHVLEDEIKLDQAKVRLVHATQTQGKYVWLESSEPVQVKKGLCKIWLSSNVCMPSFFHA
jgi:hypothetical protein